MEKGESSEEGAPTASGAASDSSKRKKSQKMDPRTPLKRQRLPVQRFQSPAEDQPQVAKSKSPREDAELVHKRGVFLAVRGDEGSFYLCRTQQNVFSNTRHFKIQWLDLVEPPDVYKFDFLDHTEIECVLMNVKMDRVTRETYRLPNSEKVKIENVLIKALKKEKGELVEEDLTLEEATEEDMEEEDEEWEDEPSPKKARVSKSKEKKTKVTPKNRKSITVALKSGKSTKSNGKKTTRTKALEKQKAEKGKRTAQTKATKKPDKEKKKGPDKKLKPNPKIKVLEKDPLFDTKDHVPFISKQAHEKLVFRAVLLNDMALLKQLKEDDQHIYSLSESRSIADKRIAVQYAMEQDNLEAVSLLTKDFYEDEKTNKRKKNPRAPLLINCMDTGSYNPKSLGIRFVRKLTVSRGSKEGNEAFTKDPECDPYELNEQIINEAVTNGVKKETMDTYIANLPEDDQDTAKSTRFGAISFAVIRGHRELAGKLVQEATDSGGFGFNFLHKDVLFNNEDLKTFQSASVRKKCFGNAQITPLHCACINPNKRYLEKLLAVEPDLNLEDKIGRRPIHFAAACDGTGPLECLIAKGANPYETTRRKFTPLHYACYAGRAQNAEIILKKAKATKSGDRSDGLVDKYGVGGINHPNLDTICPIHIAAENGDMEMLKVLIKYGADLNKPLSAGKEKLTPLMIAASHGYLDVVRLLVQNNAVVEQLDKFKRTALTHAVMNGCTTVASYLLYLGADPNRVDTSGNSLVHYAAAYGWYFVVKLLVNEGNADPTLANAWKVTPLGIAFMKGHMGLVDFLLKMPGVDINFKNDTGKTLLSIAASSRILQGLYEQVVYLMDRKADPTIADMDGMNALHHLAANTVKVERSAEDTHESKMDITVKIAELFLEGGCDPSAKTESGQTAITLAVEKVNTKLVKFLVEKGGNISAEKNEKGQNALYLLAQQCMENELAPLLQILASQTKQSDIKENGLDEPMDVDNAENIDQIKQTDNNVPAVKQLKKEASKSGVEMLKLMATEVDNHGFTPLLCACQTYTQFKKPHNVKDADYQKMFQNGREFIKRLIELTEANVSQTVQKKYFKENPPADESKHYADYGKCSAVHFMVHSNTSPLDSNGTGLKLILDFKPDLESKDLGGMTALALAVQKNSLTAVQFLVEAGSNTNVTYPLNKEEDVPILNTAAKNGNVEIVKLLLKGGAKIDGRNNKTKQTALHVVVQNRGAKETNTLEIVTALVNAGIDINTLDVDKRSALHVAVSSNPGTSNASTDVEELLISRGGNLFLKDVFERNPLHYVFSTDGKMSDSSAFDPIDLCSVLTKAMNGNQIDEPDFWGKSPLHLAAYRGATICCVHLVQRGADINKKDHQGNTSLSFAVDKKHDSCAMMLIQKGANVRDAIIRQRQRPPPNVVETKKDEKPDWVWKPVRVTEREEKTVHSIFQGSILNELQGVAHMVLDATEIDSSAVEAALKVNQYYVVLRLLKKIKDNGRLSSTNEKRQNLLHVLSLHTEPGKDNELQMKVARTLLDRGLSLSLTDENGCTPLHYAALRHQPFELAKLFIENDNHLDLHKKDKFDRNVLAAFFWNHVLLEKSTDDSNKWLTLLLSKGANLDILYDFPLSDVPQFDTFTSEVPDYFTTACAYRISPLIFSINFFKFGLLKFLLQHNASPNFKDSSGLTPLMHAVKRNDLNAVKLLLNHSYDTDEDKSDGKPKLSKKLSRQVFAIKPISSITEEDEDNDDQDDDDKEDDNDDEQSEQNEDDEEEDENEDEANDDEEVMDEGDEDMEPEDDEGSDHDTDVMDEDEDNDDSDHDEAPAKFPSLTRLGSKQPSLLRQGSSLNKDEFPVVTKTSLVDLSETDSQGWTAIHHLVSPLEYGTFDNEEILYVLARAGADTQAKDKAGLSPLDHALIRGATKLAQRLQKISAVEGDKMEKPTFASLEVDDTVVGTVTVDYLADSQEMLQRINEKNVENVDSQKEKQEEHKCPVDYYCQIKDMGEVVKDVSQGRPYDVLLSKVDVGHGVWGMYNFYKMQLVYQKGTDMYVLFTRWGRIGDSGQYQHTPFQKKVEAITEFGKIFRSKTGNYWSSVSSFENHPKKYRLVAQETKPQKVHKVDFSLESDIPSKLHPYIQDLIKEMTSVKMLTAAVGKAGLDAEVMPFGLIKRELLIEAKKVLNQLGEAVKAVEDLRKKVLTAQETAKYQEKCEELSKLTNEYYHLLPCENYAHEKIKPISSLSELRKRSKLLTDLLDLECASKILLGAQAKMSQMNPLDYVYHAVGCRIQLLSEDSAESQYILKYIYASGQKSKVKAIFKIGRPSEEDAMRKTGVNNHRLLWHGSSVANFISILHRGLLISPPEVPFTGNLFGDGIYFADSFEKSCNYCCNYNPNSNMKLMVLSEVALGQSDVNDYKKSDFEYSDLADTDFNSKKIVGDKEPDPDFDVALPYGAAIPLGQNKKTPIPPEGKRFGWRPPLSEYIVQNQSQICLRYLVQFV